MGLNGCRMEFEFEVEDGATEQEIEEMARCAAFECIEWGFEEVEQEMDSE